MGAIRHRPLQGHHLRPLLQCRHHHCGLHRRLIRSLHPHRRRHRPHIRIRHHQTLDRRHNLGGQRWAATNDGSHAWTMTVASRPQTRVTNAQVDSSSSAVLSHATDRASAMRIGCAHTFRRHRTCRRMHIRAECWLQRRHRVVSILPCFEHELQSLMALGKKLGKTTGTTAHGKSVGHASARPRNRWRRREWSFGSSFCWLC